MNCGQSNTSSYVDEATEFVKQRWDRAPRFGIVLGTGAGKVADSIDVEQVIAYQDIPNFPRSTATGHKGQLVCGKLAEADIVAMDGRFHLYEGYSVDQSTIGIDLLDRLGVEILFISNASGGINPKFSSGEIMLIQSHIDFMFRRSVDSNNESSLGRPAMRSDVYDQTLIDQANQCAREHGFPIHQGVYVAMLGPNYETRAEYRFLKRIGGDAVGMSTVPEVTVASARKMRVLAMSIISNVAKPDVLLATSGQEVIDAAAIAAGQLKTIVVNAIKSN